MSYRKQIASIEKAMAEDLFQFFSNHKNSIIVQIQEFDSVSLKLTPSDRFYEDKDLEFINLEVIGKAEFDDTSKSKNLFDLFTNWPQYASAIVDQIMEGDCK